MNSEPGSANIFVGRQQELALLEAALNDSLSGQGRVVMLAGEPGIGKTRMAQELAGLAEKHGVRTFWGLCYEQEGAPPYWPWVQLVRAYINGTGLDLLRAQMGPGAADIAEVIPELLEKLPHLKPPPALDPNQARFRLFDSFTTFFKNAAQSRPLLLVLDDLHWADEPSLLLLEFLAGQTPESRLMVVGTYRVSEVSPEHPLSGTLAQLSRNRSFHRQNLEGLTPADVGEFILAANGSKASQGLIDAVHAHTQGNPFFMNEVIRLLAERGGLNDDSVDPGTLVLEVPRGVLEVIGQRLARLSEECNDLLTTAAVIGRQFDFNLLEALTEGSTELKLIGMVEEALEAQIVQALPEAGDRYQFSHALVQQTLLERLSTSRRVRLHARVGEALEMLYGDDPGDHAAELAYHFAEAEPVAGSNKLVKYTMLAGERALGAYAQEEALGHFSRGLTAKGLDVEGSMPAPDAEAAALLFGLGRAQTAILGRRNLDVAFASLSRAFNYYFETNDVAQAVGVAEYPTQSLPGRRSVVDLVAPALQLVPPDSPEAGRLMSRYVLVMGLEEGDYQGAVEALDGALTIAERTGDVRLEMRTLANSSMVDYWHFRWTDAVAKGLRVIELARRSADLLSEVSARMWVGVALGNMGDSNGAQLHALAMLTTAERLRDRFWLATALWQNEMRSIFMGDWKAARDFNERGLLVSPSDPRLLGTRMLLEQQVGNVSEGNEYLEQIVETLRLVTPGPTYDQAFAALMIPAAARITGAADKLQVVESAATMVLAASNATPLVSNLARLGLGLIAVVRQDVAAAREHYASLGLAAGTYLFLSVDRILGLLAYTIGDLDHAEAHFEEALLFCRKAGYLPELAWTCHDHAESLLKRNRPRDRGKAVSLIEESLRISTELGMTPLLERATALKEMAGSGRRFEADNPSGLTQREVEVLTHLAQGKTNREIARELVLSERTVQRHIYNIYIKIKVRNRAEATTFALSQLPT